MKNFIKDNWFKLIIVIILVFVGSSTIYYFVVSKPGQDKTALQQQISAQDQAEAQATVRTQQLQNCTDSAQQKFSNTFTNLCNYYQMNQGQLGNPNWVCPLTISGNANPAYQTMVNEREDAIALCATLYK